ncbi:Rieske (2Fe-2S) protein [Limobrevibacterium gyesilva]|uniref:Rieske (2Fe-2S) protein n=1 Tax=Limobrevibacterium gyesilva TaxID=2991712 RepID=A0AA41YMV3_9PROT|nr:Rieske (2Fe-2S) protein [Limobrevibacterium gyesilva]MCW3475635.1 Rieske (2Fe-2S) protein [Limobrevibacterium gyesilva]
MARHVVATVTEIPPGARKLLTVAGREIGVFNIGGEYFALLNRCPHQGGALCKGPLVGLVTSREPGRFDYSRRGEMLKCPWHGWEYDVRTGQSWCDPDDVKVRLYKVSVEPGEAVARGPFVAETFAVSVEQDYIVVEV